MPIVSNEVTTVNVIWQLWGIILSNEVAIVIYKVAIVRSILAIVRYKVKFFRYKAVIVSNEVTIVMGLYCKVVKYTFKFLDIKW